jgi:hypothetical protein
MQVSPQWQSLPQLRLIVVDAVVVLWLWLAAKGINNGTVPSWTHGCLVLVAAVFQ